MTSTRHRLEGGSTNNYGSEPNTTSIDELAGVSASTRAKVELIVLQMLQRLPEPVFEAMIRRVVPTFRQVIREEMGLLLQKLSSIMTENLANNTSTSVPRLLKLKFRNKISLPVHTGKELLGENQTPIEIIMVDALTEQIVHTGTGSTAKLEILVLEDGDSDDDSWTFEEFEKRIVNEKKGTRILQGNTCLQLKDGIGFVGKISFTHGSGWTKKGRYRLGARALMAGVEVAWTEAFLIKDRRSIFYEKHYPPSLLDKLFHLEKISIKGAYYDRLKHAQVKTVKDLLILVYTNPKQLEDILKLKASSKNWDDIIKHAQTSDGMFLYLDPGSERKTGVVLNVKLELKGLVVKPRQYIPVNHLSEKQMEDTPSLVKFASENLELLHPFKDEASLKEFLQSDMSFTNQIIDEPPSPSSPATTFSSFDHTEVPDNLDNSNSHTGQSPNQSPMVTLQCGTVPFDGERTYYQQDISFHSFLESTNEPGITTHNVLGQSLDWPMDTLDDNFEESLHRFINSDFNNELHFDPANSATDIVIMATETVSVNSAQTRWTKAWKLLRRPSVRERISPRPHKKQRWC